MTRTGFCTRIYLKTSHRECSWRGTEQRAVRLLVLIYFQVLIYNHLSWFVNNIIWKCCTPQSKESGFTLLERLRRGMIFCGCQSRTPILRLYPKLTVLSTKIASKGMITWNESCRIRWPMVSHRNQDISTRKLISKSANWEMSKPMGQQCMHYAAEHFNPLHGLISNFETVNFPWPGQP